ncbi:response regulator transcription factor [Streptomyces sp. NBC_01102]|nr:response regulator transcription factor [Streptomyces sp. NBC_01102]
MQMSTPQPSPARGDGQHVLVVADDPAIVELLTTTLVLAGYQVQSASSGAEGLKRVAEHPYDLVVFDATMPGLDELQRGRRLPPADRPPVLFLTAYESLHTLVPELGLGEEDYVTKPFGISEVLARTHVLLRGRNAPRQADTPHYRDLLLDHATCEARRGARPLDLTPAEYRLLCLLLAHAERVLSKGQISRHVWGDVRADNAIEKLVSRLRRKVDVEEPALIHTRRGFGYWLGCSHH